MPEGVDLVRGTVIPVKEEVEDDSVQADLERKPEPGKVEWGFVRLVG